MKTSGQTNRKVNFGSRTTKPVSDRYHFSVATALIAFSLIVQAAPSEARRNSELLNEALSQSIRERSEVQRSYRDNPGIERSDVPPRDTEARIRVEVGSELVGGGSSSLRAFDRSRAHRYDDPEALAKLKNEMDAVDQEMAQESKNQVTPAAKAKTKGN
jgi:hypothetical protein